MKTLQTALANKKAKIAPGPGLLAVSGMAVSGMASAADTATAINTAFTGANTNVGLVVTGVIGLAAIATGVGLIIAFLKH